MASRTLYGGAVWTWSNPFTVYLTTKSNDTFTQSSGTFTPANGKVTLDADEYPTQVVLSNANVYLNEDTVTNPSNSTQNISIYLNDTSHLLTTVTDCYVNHSLAYNGTYNISGTNLVHVTLSLYYNGHRAFETNSVPKVVMTTDYQAKTITYKSVTGGTASGATSLKRNATTTVTVTPADGYVFNSITASAGTLTSSGTNTYTFKMASPGVAVTITPSFTKATVTWSNSKITVTQNETTFTVTAAGTASANVSATVSYTCYRVISNVTTAIATQSSPNFTLDLDEGLLGQCITFYIKASVTIQNASGTNTVISSDTEPCTFPAQSLGRGIVGYYDGAVFQQTIPYYYDGSQWIEAVPNYYNSSWQDCSLE